MSVFYGNHPREIMGSGVTIMLEVIFVSKKKKKNVKSINYIETENGNIAINFTLL